MKRVLSFGALAVAVTLASMLAKVFAQDEDARNAPPPMPQYQLRAEVPEGDRLDTPATGAELYSNRCGYCHLPGGMGTNMLTVQRMKLGEPPENGLLVNRKDLEPAYIKAVVRAGKGAMPRLTPVDVTDSELEKIAAYLAGDRK